jgi:hypothetical protein
MRKFLLSAGAALGLAGVAAAQDQAPAPVVPAMTSPTTGPIGGGAPIVPMSGDPLLPPATAGGPAARFYTEASFLLMWINSGSIPLTLATGGPSLGVVGQPGTTTLLGGNDVNYHSFTGLKVAVGGFFNENSRVGWELSGFYLGAVNSQQGVATTSNMVIARPFFDPAIRRANARIIAAPGAFSGGIVSDTSARVWGYETGPFFRVVQGPNVTMDIITGYRQLQFGEVLNVYDTSSVLAGGTTAFNGIGVGAGSAIAYHDRFGVTNTFYGGNIGLRTSVGRGGFFLDLAGKIAIGGVHQMVNADGSTTLVRGGGFVAPVTAPGGFLTSGPYSGLRSENRFAVLPEGDIKLGYQFTSWLNMFIGYQVMYLSSVARPGDQLSGNITVSQLPTSPNFNLRPTGQTAPQVNADDLWIHGFNFGLTVSY